MKLLILGGYGTFGGRLAWLLSDVAGLEILIAGRNGAKATAFCAAYRGAARVRPLTLDRADIHAALSAETPDIIVDASGPFQDYGEAPYRVVEAAIELGVDYLDLADGADFVEGISTFDHAAKINGRFVLSGASSFPVLTAAVLADMAKRMTIHRIEGGIAPSPFAGVGRNVLRAVLSYAGSPVALIRGGTPSTGEGLVETRRRTIAVPGHVPLASTRFSLVDVPDLRLIPPQHPELGEIWIGAGPRPESLHRLLNVLAWLRRRGLIPHLTPLAPLCHAVLNLIRFGEHRGGMYVHASGTALGDPIEESWSLIADGDDGPMIPSMAAEGIIRKCLSGDRPARGARSAIGALGLKDYQRLFAGRKIATGFHSSVERPLYRKLLGPAFDTLPRAVAEFHQAVQPCRWQGKAEVRRGTSPVARLVAALIGFPRAGTDVDVSVAVTAEGEGERWARSFDCKVFSSTQTAGQGRNEGLLVERFGPITVGLALVVQGDRLRLVPRRWFFLGMPLPNWLMPGGDTFETEAEGRFRFDVTIRAPLIGLIVAYRGWLEPLGQVNLPKGLTRPHQIEPVPAL